MADSNKGEGASSSKVAAVDYTKLESDVAAAKTLSQKVRLNRMLESPGKAARRLGLPVGAACPR